MSSECPRTHERAAAPVSQVWVCSTVRYAVLTVSHSYLAEETLGSAGLALVGGGSGMTPHLTPRCLASWNQPLKGEAESSMVPNPPTSRPHSFSLEDPLGRRQSSAQQDPLVKAYVLCF